MQCKGAGVMAKLAAIGADAALAATNRSSGCAAPTLGGHAWVRRPSAALQHAAAGLVAFGSDRSVAIYDAVGLRVLRLLAGHTARVNGVCWVPQPARRPLSCSYDDETELVSCSSDGDVRVWRIAHVDEDEIGVSPSQAGFVAPWECTAVLRGHTGSVTSVSCHVAADGALFIASCAADCTLRAWWRPAAAREFIPLGSVAVKATGVLEAVACSCLPLPTDPLCDGADSSLPSSSLHAAASYGVIIAAGGADCRVHLYTLQHLAQQGGGCGADTATAGAATLTHAISVTGPADWVRSLAFSAAPQLVEHFGAANVAGWAGSRQEAVLAAASQDAKLRLFRIRCKSYEHTTAEAAAGPVTELAAGSATSALVAAGAEDEEDDVLAAAPAPATGGASGAASASAGWADPEALLLSAEDPVLAALQRPRAFAVTIRSRGGARAAGVKATFEVTLDALLSGGHDALVSTVRWLPPLAVAADGVAAAEVAGEATSSPIPAWRLMQAPCLLSASMDKSVIMWQPEGADAGVGAGVEVGAGSAAAQEAAESRMWEGVWQPVLKVGAAGGAVAGFHGAFLTRDLSLLFAHGFQGSLHSWTVTPSAAAAGASLLGRRCTVGLPCLPSAPAFSLHVLKEESIVQPRPCAQGHAGPVTDLQWAPSGDYLLSASLDFTTRVWAPVALQGGAPCRPPLVVAAPEPGSGAGSDASSVAAGVCSPPLLPVWLEASRPQIHGYEMNAAVLPAHPRLRHRLISAGDEKVLRVFDAPRLFTRTLRLLRQPGASDESGAGDREAGGDDDAGRAEFAYVPELVLTNKAVLPGGAGGPIKDRFQADGRDAGPMGHGAAGGDDGEGGSGMAAASAAASSSSTAAAAPAAAEAASAAATLPISSAAASTVAGLLSTAGGVAPPLDEDLVQGTRWPEANKLFGHGHEVVALAVNSAGTLVASACKARDDLHASIMMWDADTGRLLQQLPAHKLTVVAMAFSPAPACISAVDSLSSPQQQVFARAGELPAEAALALSSPVCQSEYLVSASKDRCVALWAAMPQAAGAAPSGTATAAGGAGVRSLPPPYALMGLVRDAHKRIIWGADWAPLPLDREAEAGVALAPQQQLFCTGARDHVVKLWSVCRGADAAEGEGTGAAAGTQLALAAALPAAEHAVTAVAFAPVAVRQRGAAGSGSTLRLTLAAGHEDGSIALWAAVGTSEGPAAPMRWHCEPLVSVSAASKHVGSVSRLAWRPPMLPVAALTAGSRSRLQLQLASASADESLRIFRVLLAVLGQ